MEQASDYESIGRLYSTQRRTDPRIARYINAALGDAKTVLNVGAGTGSYEPLDRHVVAIEPSRTMRLQRPSNLAEAIDASAESLPFEDRSFDASMAVLTLHHWADPRVGLLELRRVTRGPVVICTFDIDVVPEFWISDYAPEFVEIDRKRFPTIEFIVNTLGRHCIVQPIPVPFDCVDGIQEAFYGRPEAFLDPAVRRGQSVWASLPQGIEDRIVQQLASDLASGEWDRRYGALRTEPEFHCALRLITCIPAYSR